MTNDIFIQLIGVAATGFILVSFQLNKRSTILTLLLIGQVLFTIHFGLLGAWTAVAIDIIAAVRGCIYYFKPRYHWAQQSFWLVLFIALFWVGGLLTWEGYHSLWLIIAMSIESVALWNDNPKYIRWLMLLSRPLFFSYNLTVGSYAGMGADILFSISIITGMIRLDRK